MPNWCTDELTVSPVDAGDRTSGVVRTFFEANAKADEPICLPLTPSQRVAFLMGRPGPALPADVSRLILTGWSGPPRYAKRYSLPFDFARSAPPDSMVDTRQLWGTKCNAQARYQRLL